VWAAQLERRVSLPFTVAIVDDDDSVRVAVGSLVRSLGFQALSFASAEDFLASGRLGEVDCLITDVQMPGMSGPELQSHLASERSDLPVILITAFPEERLRRQAEEAGAYGFLAKPFDGQAMIRCLEAALESRDAARR
jgi:FixJ family two-component response regulator